ncbi:FCGR2 protein, partial [Pygoscelis papua]
RPSLADWLVLQVPVRALVEGDELLLRCRGWKDSRITEVEFLREREVLGGPSWEAELLLPALQLHHSGRYRCQATMGLILGWQKSALVTVVVQGEHPLPST